MRFAPVTSGRGLAAALALALAVSAEEAAAGARELSAQIDQLSVQVRAAESALRALHKGSTARPEPDDDDVLRARFAEAEIHFVSGEYQPASLMLYDLVSTEAFRRHRRYPDALFLLAEALYQQENYLGARLYLRELLQLSPQHRRRALPRYIEVSGRLNDFSGIDLHVEEAREARGELSGEVAYVYGKWLLRRSDLPRRQRLTRALELFQPLAADPRSEQRLQSAFFLGAARLQLGELDPAADHFAQLARHPAATPREARLVDLARLALARVRFEQRRYPDALAAYAEVPAHSALYPDALYESSWASVKAGDLDGARRGLDALLEQAKDSPLLPEAWLLQAHLSLKQRRYDEAERNYRKVIDRYVPVHDEVSAVLAVQQDPGAWFDDLRARNARKLDVATLLPPVAMRWAQRHGEVSDAVRMIEDLDEGRRAAAEAREVARRLTAALDRRRLETFPEVQAGFALAEALDTRLSRLSAGLLRLQTQLLEGVLDGQERAALRQIQERTGPIARRLQALPSTPEEVEARRGRLQAAVDEVDREALRVSTELQRLEAILRASERWLTEQQAPRRSVSERELLLAMRHEENALLALRDGLEETRRSLSIERAAVDAALDGETRIRLEFDRAVDAQHAALAGARARAQGEQAAALGRAERVRGELAELKGRLSTLRKIFRFQLEDRGARFKERVLLEERRLREYQGELDGATRTARLLVGRVALDGFEKVRRQFFELALKADVGLLDVAFTRKQDFTADIQRLSAQKEEQLRALDEEFSEVLRDVE